MALLTGPVAVRVPATSANLGPGFDSLGLALELHDVVTAQCDGEGIRVSVHGEGADELPRDERHLVAQTMATTFELLGEARPAGLRIDCQNAIPQARGLGSSSAAIVAGIMLARELTAGGAARLGTGEIIKLAARIEGHPDNVAPCVLGGFTIAWDDEQTGAHAVRVDDQPAAGSGGVRAVVFVPPGHGYTAQARAALPTSVPFADAVFNAARSALLVRALTGAPELLFEATRDRLHQGYRAATMPASAELLTSLRSAKIAATISGAGPSVLALADQPAAVTRAASLCPDGWRALELPADENGARMIR